MALGVTRKHGIDATTPVSPETANLDIGSMSFEIFPLLKKVGEGKLDWKPEFLVRARDFMLRGELATVECAVRHLGHALCTRCGFECHDPGHLFRDVHFVGEGLERTPILAQVMRGTLGAAALDRCMPWRR